MARDLRQSTSATIRVGPVIDATGAVVTTATITIRLSKAGGGLANRNDSTSITHDSDGYYLVTLNETDTNTVGRLRVGVTGSGFLPFNEDYMVLASAVFDVIYGTTAPSTLTAGGVRTELATELGRIDAAISTRSTYAGGDTSGTTTLLARLTSDRAGYLDKLNVPGTLAHTDNASTFRADVSGLSTLDAAGVRSAVGLASANLDTQLDALPTAAEVASAVLAELDDSATTAAEIADAVHDEVVEGSRTLRQLMRGVASALLGKASGLSTATATYRDTGDTKARITATVDADGNRSAVTLDLD